MVTAGWETMLVVGGRKLPIACTTTCNWCTVVGQCSASYAVVDTIGVARRRQRTMGTFDGALLVGTMAGPCCYCPVCTARCMRGIVHGLADGGRGEDGRSMVHMVDIGEPSGLTVEVLQATRERHCRAPRCTVRAMHNGRECTALYAPPTLCMCLAGICFCVVVYNTSLPTHAPCVLSSVFLM